MTIDFSMVTDSPESESPAEKTLSRPTAASGTDGFSKGLNVGEPETTTSRRSVGRKRVMGLPQQAEGKVQGEPEEKRPHEGRHCPVDVSPHREIEGMPHVQVLDIPELVA